MMPSLQGETVNSLRLWPALLVLTRERNGLSEVSVHFEQLASAQRQFGRLFWLFCAFAMAALGPFGCATPPEVNLSCHSDPECGQGSICVQGECKPEIGCQADTDCTKWSDKLTLPGATADNSCTKVICDLSDKLCKRVGNTTQACTDDGISCTVDLCTTGGTCGHTLTAQFCLIDKQCVAAQAVKSKDEDCLVCNPSVDTATWTPADVTVTCQGQGSDGNTCENHTCAKDGKCGNTPKENTCDSGQKDGQGANICLSDGQFDSGGCKKCNGSSHALENQTAGTTCSGGDVCHQGTCGDQGTCNVGALKPDFCFIADDKGVKTCVGKGVDKSNLCRACDPANAATWTNLDGATKCDEDGITCTKDFCDGSGSCTHTPDSTLCAGFNGDCVVSECQVANGGCANTSLATDTTCTKSDDGLPCTTQHCDGKGVCDPKLTTVDPTVCVDGIACTDKACDPSKGCVFTPNAGGCDDNNDCTIDACDGATGCVHTPQPKDTGCATDGLPCTVDVCDGANQCIHTQIAADSCLVDGTCVAAGADKAGEPCLACTPASNQLQWTAKVAGIACPDDGTACTVDACNGLGSCDHSAVKADTCLIGGSCYAKGDKSGDCLTCDSLKTQTDWTPIAANAPCTDDGKGCTVDQCDGKGACNHESLKANSCLIAGTCYVQGDKEADCTECNTAISQTQWSNTAKGQTCTPDMLACTIDACDGKGVCGHSEIQANHCLIDGACKAQGDKKDDCSRCDAVTSQVAWTPFVQGTACTDDGAGCTTDVCDGKGVCDHSGITAGTCNFGNAAAPECHANGETKNGGCQFCDASKPVAWSIKAAATDCAADTYSCTVDKCDAAGACQHTATDSLCADASNCTTHLCKPGDAQSNLSTGCFKVDTCPWGHQCDAAANACLSYSAGAPGPVTLVGPSDNVGTPTNPTVVRLKKDDGTGRTWVIFQDNSAVSLNGSAWQVSGKSALHALVLDDQVAAPANKVKPVLLTLPALGSLSALNVTQAFAQAIADPLDPKAGWVSWLEADPVTATCLQNKGQGGVVRLARLDGSGVTAGESWPAVAGSVCTATGSNGPNFHTLGMGLLDMNGVDSTDPTKRGLVAIRGFGFDLADMSSVQLQVGPLAAATTAKLSPTVGSFSTVHPVLVDVGIAEKTNRYWSLAFTEKTSSNVARKLWALPIDPLGVDGDPQTWLAGNQTPLPASPGDLDGVTAVCALDAAVDAGGVVAVAMVVRKGSNNIVLLGKFKAGVKQGNVITVASEVQADSEAPCQYGIIGARITPWSDGFAVTYNEASSGVGDPAKLHVGLVNGVGAVTTLTRSFFWWSTDAANALNLATLANRGIVPASSPGNGVMSLISEAKVAGFRAIVIDAFKP